MKVYTYPPMKMKQCSETSAYKMQTRGNYPEENIQQPKHGESLKPRRTLHVSDRLTTSIPTSLANSQHN